MILSTLRETFAICRLEKDAPLPGWLLESTFFSASRTRDELSLVCPRGSVPDGITCNGNWRCLKVEGPLPFTMTGVLASITAPLANARIPVFVLSTYDTDYILVKDGDLEAALGALREEGHMVRVDGEN